MAKRGILITGGEKPLYPVVKDVFGQSDAIVIACDSGLNWAVEWGITPDYLIGDMDSADKKACETIAHSSVKEVRLDTHKDDTDTAAGVELAISLGAEELVIIGGTGGRLDHSLANLHVLYDLLKRGIPARMEGERETVHCTCGRFPLKGQTGKTVSVLPLFEDCELSLSGFLYPLDHYNYRCGSTIGTSNVVLADEAVISVHRGSVFILIDRDKV